ncbi:fibronectin type III domain-containing protein [Sphaerisporangium sp. NPDC051011]|uniref:fibronectin type III domain-containing protein n=1 Tax=Sphaerisporangium sp. NPDC051011 TaxID=3155792 RepID=UPI0033CCBFAA
MSVTEIVQALGSWGVQLAAETPQQVLDQLDFLGHVAIVPGRVVPAQYGDALLKMARYVGVLTSREFDTAKKVGGQGMALWLGDADRKGEVLETPVQPIGETFANTFRMLLAGCTAIVEGTLYSVPGSYTGWHQWQTRRDAIDYVCSTMGAEWRVNGDATVDGGPVASLYSPTPACAIVRKGGDGRDLTLTALPGEMSLQRDVADYSTRVVLIAEGQGAAVATGSATAGSTPYLDIRGNPVRRTRVISESGTSAGNADSRAAMQLGRFTGTRNALRLSSQDYDIRGSFRPGEYIWVHDPDSGLVDEDNEVIFLGERLNPVKLRAMECSWPIVAGMTVAYRTQAGTWIDLSDYVAYETGQTSITVGDLNRSLTNSGSEPVGSRPRPDITVPGVVSWDPPFGTSVFLDGLGFTHARIQVAWDLPLNTDGSTILDGRHFEIAYGVSPASSWEKAYAAWGDLQAVIGDLSPGVTYDFRIRAVDQADNAGAWSATVSAMANPDTIPPSTPAAPTVAASLIALQVTHTLGKASGGTWNLELDLDHLEVHVGATAGFTPDATTLRGKAAATAGMMQAEIAAVATVPATETTVRYVRVIAVDQSGNRSAPSAAVTATALLIDDAHISDLTVSKVTAGTISANWLLGASIRTASSGARVELNSTGLHGFNAGGIETVSLLNTGSFTLRTGTSGARVVIDASGVETFDSAGNKTVDINAGDGSVLIVGQVTSSQTASKRLVINPGPTAGSYEPEIRLYEEYPTDFHYWTQDTPGAHEMELGSAVLSSRKSRIKMSPGGFELGYTDSGGNRFGGYVQGDSGGAELGMASGGRFRATPGSTTVEAGSDFRATAQGANYIISQNGGVILQGNNGDIQIILQNAGSFRVKGRVNTTESDSAFAGGKVAASGTAGAIGYGVTYVTTPYPPAMVRAGNTAAFVVTSNSPSGFNFSWAGPALSSSTDTIGWFGRREP